MTTQEAPPKATSREWLGLGVLALATMLTMLDINVLFLAMPELSRDLGATAVEQLWITDIYGFVIAGFLVIMGTLGDRIGRRTVLLWGAGAFGIASLVAAFSVNAEMLIIARGVLGIAGATIMPCTLALIMGMFKDPKQLGTAMSVWASAMMVGVALGPVIGGILLGAFWWGSVFLIAIPIMLLLVAVGPFTLPDDKDASAGRLDLLSAVLVIAAMLPLVYGLKELARTGLEPTSIVAVVVGLVLGVIFVRRQRRLETPLLDVGLFAIPAVAGALTIGLLIGASQGGGGFLITQHLQYVEGLDPLAAGLWMLIPSVVLVAGIYGSAPLNRWIGPGYVLAGGMLVAAVGWLVLTQLQPTGSIGTLIVGFSLVFLGVSPVGMLVNMVVMGQAPPERVGGAASLHSTSGELGVAVGIAALGSVATSVYRGGVEVPAEVPADAAAAARDNAAAAQIVAGDLPPEVGNRLVESAQEAFNTGVTTVAGVAIAVFVVLAGVAVTTMRGIPPTAAPAPAEDGADAEEHATTH